MHLNNYVRAAAVCTRRPSDDDVSHLPCNTRPTPKWTRNVVCSSSSSSSGELLTPASADKLCGRPPQYVPARCKLTFDLESGVRVTCDVGYLGANFSLPRPLCSRLRPDVRDRQTSDAHHRLINAFLTQSAVHDVCYLVSRYDMHGARPLIHQFTASHFRLSDINSNPCSSPTPVRPLRRPRGSFHHDAAGRPAWPVRATAFAWTTSAWAVGATCTLYGQ